MIQLAKKTIHSQKTVLGTTILTNENNRIVATSSKGLFGEEVFLDSNGRFAGTKRKGILGEEHYFDKDGHLIATTRDGVLGAKITVDQNGKYMGTSYKGLGSDQITVLDGETDDTPEQHSGAAIGLLFFVICVVIAVSKPFRITLKAVFRTGSLFIAQYTSCFDIPCHIRKHILHHG